MAETCIDPLGLATAMQLMIAVFDFPAWTDGQDDHLFPDRIVE